MGRKRKTPEQLIQEREALDAKITRAQTDEAIAGTHNSPFLVELVAECKELMETLQSSKLSLAENGPQSLSQRIRGHQLWIDEYSARLEYEQNVSQNAGNILKCLQKHLGTISARMVRDKTPNSATYDPLVQAALTEARTLESSGEDSTSLKHAYQDARAQREQFARDKKAPKNPRNRGIQFERGYEVEQDDVAEMEAGQ